MLPSTKARVGAVISLVLPYLVTASLVPRQQEILGLASPGQEDSHILRRIQVSGNSTVTLNDILGAAQDYNLDVWQVRSSSVDVHLTPAEQTQLHHIFEESGITYTDSLLPNSLVHPQSVRPQVSTWNLSSLSNTTFHTDYRTTEEIGTFVKELIDLYPDQARLVPIGHSSEHREMFALEITANQTSFKKKTGFVITGAQHAREWIATSTALFIAHALLADPSESYSMAPLLATFDFYLVLLPNPDGYVYTWETDRFWYKNRQVVGPNAKCVGIDMNRNWGYKWKSKALFPAKKKNKTGTDPCAPWFPGHRAWEAPEVNNIANYITTLPNLRAHIDLRSYGQMISSPYSFSCKKTSKDAEDQLEAALGASQALKAAHGTSFITGSLCSLLYKAPGNIIDYLYARAGIKYSYAVHLRDTGTYGFVLPPEWIRPVGEETANMIKSLAGFVVGKKF